MSYHSFEKGNGSYYASKIKDGVRKHGANLIGNRVTYNLKPVLLFVKELVRENRE